MEPEYKAKLQLRPKNEELYNFVISQLNKNNVQVTRLIELKEGIDIYISSAEFAVKLGKLFKRQFRGTVKTTNSLTSQDKRTLKRIYKLTVLMRLPKE